MGSLSEGETVYQHYALADPRVEDEVKRVRYIGRTVRGLTKRNREHLRQSCLEGRSHRAHWIKQLLSLGLKPVLIDMGDGPESRESELIALWRARGADLTNNTLGGDGASGCQWTDEQRADRSIVAREVAARPGWKEKVAEATREALSSPEMQAKIAAGVNAHLAKPGAMEQRRAISRATAMRPDVRAKIDAPELRARMAERAGQALNTPEARAKARQAHLATCADPEWREKFRQVALAREADGELGAKRSATYRARRLSDPDNERIRVWVADGMSTVYMARQLDWAWRKLTKRIERLRQDGVI
jgi:hypothetical protein